MSNTHECIGKAELIELRRRAALYEEQKPKQWEPPEGAFVLSGDGIIEQCYAGGYTVFGASFTSREQAQEAMPLIRSHNRLIRYVQEHGGIQKFEQGLNNWTITSETITSDAEVVNCRNSPLIDAIYMTKSCAESLAAGMKDGSIEL